MSQRVSTQPRVAFQGELGAFSQEAIHQFFGPRVEPAPCSRFEEAFVALATGRVRAAVIPIENTLAGSVHENYDHLLKFHLEISGETNVRIVHNLIVPPGVKWRELRKVYSHPVALNQCLDFFARHRHLEPVTFYDTAGSVKMIMERKPPGTAAIASSLAATIYGAHVLKRSIEDDRKNFTRFFLLRKPAARLPRLRPPERRRWKTSVVFAVRNTPGSLFRAMSAFALRDLNLTKIESRPLRGKPWEYLFYVDFIGHRDEERVQNALRHLGELTDLLRVLGSYREWMP